MAANLNEVGQAFAELYHVEMSDSHATLFKALVTMQASLGTVTKGKEATVFSRRTNKSYTYKYANLADCWAQLQEPMKANGLAYIQTLEPSRITAGGLMLVTWIIHEDGEWLRSYFPLGGLPEDPRTLGSHLTYYRRYALCAITGLIVADEDSEADVAKGTNDKADTDLRVRHATSINAIKDAIKTGDLESAAYAWAEVPWADADLLGRAPSKGGAFTTQERGVIKSAEFRAAVPHETWAEHDAGLQERMG